MKQKEVVKEVKICFFVFFSEKIQEPMIENVYSDKRQKQYRSVNRHMTKADNKSEETCQKNDFGISTGTKQQKD